MANSLNWTDFFNQNPLRSLVLLSFWINYKIGGSLPLSYHIVNLSIHLLNGMLVFGITRLLLKTPALKKEAPSLPRNLLALAAALLFICHPVQTQAVTYIVQRMTSMASLFYLAAVVFYLRFRVEGSLKFYLLALLTALFSMISKEISFTLPWALLLCEIFFFPPRERTIPRLLQLLLPFLLVSFLVPWTYRHPVQIEAPLSVLPQISEGLPHSTYLITQLDVIRTYFGLLIFPVRQTFDYDFPLSAGFFSPGTFLSFTLIVIVLLAGCLLFRKQRLASFGIFWFFLALSVESTVIPLADVIFEHRLYLPLAGFAFFVVSLLARLFKSPRTFTAVLLVVITSMGLLTYRRNAIWSNELDFWKDQVKKAPLKGRGYSFLGAAYDQNHQYLEAAESYIKALQLTPPHKKNPIFYNNIGSAYSRLGNPSKANYWYRKGLEAFPKSGILYTNLAVLKEKEGRLEEAASLAQKSILLSPRTPIAYYELAHIHALQKKYAEAIPLLEQAIALDPFLRPAYELLAKIYAIPGDNAKIPEAIETLKRAVKISSHDPFFYVLLGELYLALGRDEDAVSWFRKAIAASPSSRKGYNALALFYKNKGDDPKALAVITEYLKVRGNRKLLA